MRLSIIILCIFLLPAISFAGKWSDFQIAAKINGVEISYHIRELKDGWFIEWKAPNNGSEWGQPVSKSRTYTCEDGNQVAVDKEGNFGPLPPGENRKMVHDAEICAGSRVEKAEIEIEVKVVPESVKKMYE